MAKAITKKVQAKKLGAPKKNETLRTDHLRQNQWDRLELEAEQRNKSTWAFIRDMLDWGITALDTKRGDVAASKMFDDILAEGEKD